MAGETQEVSLFPELHGTLEPGEDGKKWFVVHTKSRCEKKLARWAHANKIEYYLPLIDSFRVYKSKKAHFLKVLISSYFFAKCTQTEKQILVRAGHVAGFIVVNNQEELVNDLKRIYNAKSLNLPMEEVKIFKEGHRVKITSGALIGLTGIVENVDNPDKLIIKVNVINKAVSIKLPKTNLTLAKRQDYDEEDE